MIHRDAPEHVPGTGLTRSPPTEEAISSTKLGYILTAESNAVRVVPLSVQAKTPFEI